MNLTKEIIWNISIMIQKIDSNSLNNDLDLNMMI